MIFFRPIEWRSMRREMYRADLESSASPRATEVFINPASDRWVLNDDATRLAVIDGKVLSVTDVTSRKVLGAVRLSGAVYRSRMFFVSPDVVRVYDIADVGTTPDQRFFPVDILEFDVAKRKVARLGHFEATGRFLWLSASSDGSRLLTRYKNSVAEGMEIRDGRTAALLWSSTSLHGFSQILDDGSVAIPQKREGAMWVDLIRDGQRVRAVKIGNFDHLIPTLEVAPGKLLLSASDDGKPRRWTQVVIDVNRGAVERVGPGLRATSWWWAETDPRRPPTGPVRAFVDQKGGLVRWDPLAGDQKVVIAGKM
jgi:hypothetical protein